ncbi:MAG TPA: hypothetical protein VK760_07790 [Candidatus Acidoferrales bacterium]|jgi:hypothetical protein|nr:hypothetical protein [Candidatus Acidoferrales bacterium]
MSKHHNQNHHREEYKEGVKAVIESARTSAANAIPTTNDFRNLAKAAFNAVKENPIGVLLSSVAIGFLAGSLLPSTPIEDERLGALKSTLQTHAQTVGSGVIEHGKAVIRDTVAAAQHSAQQHGAEFAEEMRTTTTTITS